MTRRSAAPNYADASTFTILTYHPPTARDMWIFRSDTTLVAGVGVLGGLPSHFALEQNYPNPFNPVTQIDYTIGGFRIQESGFSHVRLSVYDILGREVAVLVNERQAPGSYRVQFNAAGLSSGVYFYRMETRGFVQTRKLLLVR